MFGAVYQCYLCIFVIAESDMTAARIIFYKMQADSSMNPGLVLDADAALKTTWYEV